MPSLKTIEEVEKESRKQKERYKKVVKAGDLKTEDRCLAYFTDSICRVIDVSYTYGRTSVTLSYVENGISNLTSISRDTEVKVQG